ncbi:MAG: hypothetical protein JNK11_08875 [Alphaproteobacteria bacterium]|nr:hypothetical protein [Alphaproteobacteria bacterium]
MLRIGAQRAEVRALVPQRNADLPAHARATGRVGSEGGDFGGMLLYFESRRLLTTP